MLKMPYLSGALDVREIDGKLFFDLEQLLDLMYRAANESSVASTKMRDPALGIMTIGMVGLCKALDDVLAAHQEQLEGKLQKRPCSLSVDHPTHRTMFARKVYQCPGLPVST